MYRILLGVPSSGTISEGAAQASYHASLRHQVDRVASNASGSNFNRLWTTALNQGMKGIHTHFAMMHTDIAVPELVEGVRWIDVLVEEMDKHGLDFISVPAAIKDERGLTSSGVGNPDCRWNPWRRFTTMDIGRLPETFSVADTDHPDKFLLHNTTLCLFDMRKGLWYRPTDDGSCRAIFNFEERVHYHNNQWMCDQESEDWKFSRDLWKMGAKTAITSRVKIIHEGKLSFESWGEWGTYKDGDQDTASQWRSEVRSDRELING